MLNNIQNVQVSDTTGDDSSIAVENNHSNICLRRIQSFQTITSAGFKVLLPTKTFAFAGTATL